MSNEPVQVIYVWLRSPELAVQRVAERVRRGGHSVPPEAIRRRYRRGLANFWVIYRSLADAWILCDNSGADAVVVARGERGVAADVLDWERYHEIERSASAR